MKQYSIRARKLMYFRLLALLDSLWNQNFQQHKKLDRTNIFLLQNVQKITEQLALLEQLPLPQHQFARPHLERIEPTQEAT